ncbi:hypothetical protein HDU87_007462 [Geranomyces variabilis]|uniref:Tyrosinase copper-binding domain-containing protein n=1 Tax=Geranomyces variabilis TaxID=109894 RepID=A0AAD5TRK7_9FUNG|nr:hypothetical protein HDU87_007462 [Geranomyces variabilis]
MVAQLAAGALATLVLAGFAAAQNSSPTAPLSAASGIGKCTAPVVRREFRQLSDDQKQSFIDANLCLRDPNRSPSVLGPEIGSPSLYDDLVWVHSTGAPLTHNAASFLPWHRQFLGIYEYWLNKNCGYSGGIPFWDWSIDSQAPERSPILSDQWFGGNGRGADDCITNGQFKNVKTYFPVTQRAACIARRFNSNDQGGDSSRLPPFPSYAQVMEILELGQDYDEFRHRLESNPHALVHDAIGGHMGQVKWSTNDNLFWLHHCNIDRLYDVWQAEHPDLALEFDGAELDKNPGEDASSSDRLRYYGIYPDKSVKSVLSPSSGDLLCYTYTNSLLHDSAAAAPDGPSIQRRSNNHLSFAAWRESRLAAAADGTGAPSPAPQSSPPAASEADPQGSPSDPTTPSPYDRNHLYNLRHTLPVSEEHFRSIGYSDAQIARARADEQLYRDFIDYANSASGYISKNALVYVESATGYHAPSDDEAALRATLTKMLCHAANTVLLGAKAQGKNLADIFDGFITQFQAAAAAKQDGGNGRASSLAMIARPVASFRQAYKRMLA